MHLLFLTGAFVRGSNQSIDIFIVGDMNRAKLAQIVAEMEKEMTRELNYTAMRLEDFDYRRNLNDRFLTDILDAKKDVVYDDIGIFKRKSLESAITTDEEGGTHISIDMEEENV